MAVMFVFPLENNLAYICSKWKGLVVITKTSKKYEPKKRKQLCIREIKAKS